jgi:phospholipase/carboxylesterase
MSEAAPILNVHRVTPTGKPDRLVVLLHGVGSSGAAMLPLAEALRDFLPSALILAPDGPHPFDGGAPGAPGRQWFSIRQITPAERPRRIEGALPSLLEWLPKELSAADLPASALSLVGFSQGAILSLSATALGLECGAVIAFAGRLAHEPRAPGPNSPALYLGHGEDDGIIAIEEGEDAAERLKQAGYAVTFERYPGAGHMVPPVGINAAGRFLAGRGVPSAEV